LYIYNQRRLEMMSEKALLREALRSARKQAFTVFRHSNEHPGAERSGVYALGRYEGLREALRLLDHRRRGVKKPEIFGPPAPGKPTRTAFPPFVIFS
jgi:hypothetical protein